MREGVFKWDETFVAVTKVAGHWMAHSVDSVDHQRPTSASVMVTRELYKKFRDHYVGKYANPQLQEKSDA